MKKQDPLDKMLSQFSHLLDVIEQTKSKKVVDELPPDIEDRLKRLEEGVNLLKKISNQAMKDAGITEETLKAIQRNPPPRHSKEGLTLERAKKLRGIVQEIEQSFKTAYQIAKRREEIYGKKKGEKNVAKARKKKFKRLGGDKDWVPL